MMEEIAQAFRNCGTCRYGKIPKDQYNGSCHRYPPKEGRFDYIGRGQWCGEWRQKVGKTIAFWLAMTCFGIAFGALVIEPHVKPFLVRVFG